MLRRDEANSGGRVVANRSEPRRVADDRKTAAADECGFKSLRNGSLTKRRRLLSFSLTFRLSHSYSTMATGHARSGRKPRKQKQERERRAKDAQKHGVEKGKRRVEERLRRIRDDDGEEEEERKRKRCSIIGQERIKKHMIMEHARDAYGPYFTGTTKKTWTFTRMVTHNELVRKILKHQGMDPNLWRVRMTMRVPSFYEVSNV
ncbi:hypothetical protein M9H77_18140 [Catharanthus roseus]|uniref:Uncharacterized protein n=1 Tax=Catharanthus roseus TaxID=4058 RepID=A0ACC0B6T9_CATRO|nr:hypothetical protein M9H77_18140 [Catharanthus roseus]